MRLLITFSILVFFIIGCKISKNITYSFQSDSVADSIIATLKNHENVRKSSYQETNWFAVIREDKGSYELIINEKFGGKESPINKVVKTTNRYIQINKDFQIPIVFESDILSLDMWKNKVGTIN